MPECTPAALSAASECIKCALTARQIQAAKVALLCSWAFNETCDAPLAPDTLTVLGTTTSTITFSWAQPLSIPPITIASYVIRWGSSSGNYDLGSATISGALTSYTITGLTASETVYITVQAIAADGCPGVVSAESAFSSDSGSNGLLSGLVSYWPIDGALGVGALGDDSKDGNIMSVAGGSVNAINGLFPGTGYFGNGSLSINVAPANLRLGNGASFTFQTWVKAATFANPGTFGGQYSAIGATSSWIFYCNGTNARFLCFCTDASSQAVVSANLVADNATWNHLIGGYDAATKTLFLHANGGARVSAVTTADLNSVATLFGIGHDQTGETFVGGNNQAAFWNRALSITDVSNLYNGGAGLPFASFGP